MDTAGLVVDHPVERLWRVRIDRPTRANALDEATIEGLHAAITSAEADPDCRVIVLGSTGRHFCSGFDMRGYDGNPDSRGGADAVVAKMDRLADLPLRLRASPRVVLAAVGGAAVGAGFALALGADIVLVGESARFQLPQTMIGVLAAEMGISFLLPRIVGMNRAAAMMLCGGAMGAAEAVACGLAAELHPDDRLAHRAIELAGDLCARSGVALAGTKQMLLAAMQSTHLDSVTRAETRAQVIANYSPELRMAIAEFNGPHSSK